jgi:hypothetical protein
MSRNVQLEEAARELIVLVRAHRISGDGDLDAVVDRVEAALAAQDAR